MVVHLNPRIWEEEKNLEAEENLGGREFGRPRKIWEAEAGGSFCDFES